MDFPRNRRHLGRGGPTRLLAALFAATMHCSAYGAYENSGLILETEHAVFSIGLTKDMSAFFEGHMASICARERDYNTQLKVFHVEVRDSDTSIRFTTSETAAVDSEAKRISFGIHNGEEGNVRIAAQYYRRFGASEDWVPADQYAFDIKEIVASAIPIDTPDDRPVTNLDCRELDEAIAKARGEGEG